ncbi:MAG: hypothetical protein V7723_10435 [Sneathiella sp.]|uniref:hypothetical protein n=1 Tax=Sneathiella sp. TaxID=1964365 RepID=UPI0030034F08
MAAALTIVFLLAVSVLVVRIASVAMRLTGLPDNVARLQCISALTGTGFTTQESEMIVNYPLRRRILVSLMIFGQLGLVSVASTFIVTFIGTENETGALAFQTVSILIAIGIIFLVATNKYIDRVMCGMIGIILRKVTSLGTRKFHRLLQLEDGFSIAEHLFTSPENTNVKDLQLDTLPLTLLSVRTKEEFYGDVIDENANLSSGAVLVCYGSDIAHDLFESRHKFEN